jgi:hypothetical protein
MPRRGSRPLKDAQASRPASPWRADGTLDPREWRVACSAAGVLELVTLQGQPWFVCARPVELPGVGVQLEVTVRWDSTEVRDRVPVRVDGFPVEVAVQGQPDEPSTLQ